MIKITNEIDGKLYELVPEGRKSLNPCNGCAFYSTKSHFPCSLLNDDLNGCRVCYELRGVWKEVNDVKQYEYGVESFYNWHWIIEQTGFDELCEANDYIDIHKQNHPEDKLRPVRREIGEWEEVKDNEKTN